MTNVLDITTAVTALCKKAEAERERERMRKKRKTGDGRGWV